MAHGDVGRGSEGETGEWSGVASTLHTINRSVFTSAQHLFLLIRIGLHVSTVIQSSSGPFQRL